MSKRTFMARSWDLASMITGEHKVRCLALGDMTGLSWVCRHLEDHQGQKALYYVAPRGPARQVGFPFIDIMNHQLYEGQPVFEMVGADQSLIAVKVDTLKSAKQSEIDPEATAQGLRNILYFLTAEQEAQAMIGRAQASSLHFIQRQVGL